MCLKRLILEDEASHICSGFGLLVNGGFSSVFLLMNLEGLRFCRPRTSSVEPKAALRFLEVGAC